MEQELQGKLFKKYPEIFRQKDLSMQETCMCWGITTGDGWYNIIDTLCRCIQHHIKWKNEKIRREFEEKPKTLIPIKPAETIICEATQVKEKFGSLRFYYQGGDKHIEGLVAMAEAISSTTCEDCGGVGTPSKSGWIHVLCSSCKKNRYKKQKNK